MCYNARSNYILGGKMLPFSDDELLNPVKESLKNVMPMLERDGGGLKLLGIKDGVVYIYLTGHCTNCPASDITLKNGIQHQLRVDIHPQIIVKNVSKDFKL